MFDTFGFGSAFKVAPRLQEHGWCPKCAEVWCWFPDTVKVLPKRCCECDTPLTKMDSWTVMFGLEPSGDITWTDQEPTPKASAK